jgi:hypothetical protein
MKACERQASGDIELYFYGELDPSERSSVEQHVAACSECRRAFEELSMIRAALATRPQVDAPPDGDWRAFMQRLDDAIRFEGQTRNAARVVAMPLKPSRRPWSFAPHLAVAALVTLVASGVVYYTGRSVMHEQPATTRATEQMPVPAAIPIVAPTDSRQAAFAALSEQHFERSKLVVLGLAHRNPRGVTESDWAYERELASHLLGDTRLYRIAAEEHGMKTLAGVMGDLEIVLLQTSQAQQRDPEALEQIQRLIEKRNLVTKMEVATTGTGS